MAKALFKATATDTFVNMMDNNGIEISKVNWFVEDERFKETFEAAVGFTYEEIKMFAGHEVPMEELPEDVQEEIRGTLTCFDRCNLWFENHEFHAMAGCGVKARYAEDHYGLGTYKAEDVYTKEERMENYKMLAQMEF